MLITKESAYNFIEPMQTLHETKVWYIMSTDYRLTLVSKNGLQKRFLPTSPCASLWRRNSLTGKQNHQKRKPEKKKKKTHFAERFCAKKKRNSTKEAELAINSLQ